MSSTLTLNTDNTYTIVDEPSNFAYAALKGTFEGVQGNPLTGKMAQWALIVSNVITYAVADYRGNKNGVNGKPPLISLGKLGD